MKSIERKQLESIKKEIATGRETWKIVPFIEGMGIEITKEGFAYVGNAVIDLRFENLSPEIRIQK